MTRCAEVEDDIVISICTKSETDETVSFVVDTTASCTACNATHTGCAQAVNPESPEPGDEP